MKRKLLKYKGIPISPIVLFKTVLNGENKTLDKVLDNIQTNIESLTNKINNVIINNIDDINKKITNIKYDISDIYGRIQWCEDTINALFNNLYYTDTNIVKYTDLTGNKETAIDLKNNINLFNIDVGHIISYYNSGYIIESSNENFNIRTFSKIRVEENRDLYIEYKNYTKLKLIKITSKGIIITDIKSIFNKLNLEPFEFYLYLYNKNTQDKKLTFKYTPNNDSSRT